MTELTNHELAFFLAKAEKGDDAVVRAWMERTPRDRVNHQLRAVIKQGRPALRDVTWAIAIASLCSLALFVVLVAIAKTASTRLDLSLVMGGLVPPIVMLLGIAPFALSAHRFRKGRFAILLLENGDRDAMIHLLPIWQAASRAPDLVWREKTTLALVQALDKHTARTNYDHQDHLVLLAESLLLLPSPAGAEHDLNESETDVLASILRYLHRSQGRNATACIAQIAALPPVQAHPNRTLVGETAASLVATTSLPPQSVGLSPVTAPPVTPMPQTQNLHRSTRKN